MFDSRLADQAIGKDRRARSGASGLARPHLDPLPREREKLMPGYLIGFSEPACNGVAAALRAGCNGLQESVAACQFLKEQASPRPASSGRSLRPHRLYPPLTLREVEEWIAFVLMRGRKQGAAGPAFAGRAGEFARIFLSRPPGCREGDWGNPGAAFRDGSTHDDSPKARRESSDWDDLDCADRAKRGWRFRCTAGSRCASPKEA